MATVMSLQVHAGYVRKLREYAQMYGHEARFLKGDEDEPEGGGEDNHGEKKDPYEVYEQLMSMPSSSMTFTAVYTVIMALALNIYGSTAIVGFTSLRGVYIGPCFSSPGTSRLKLGVFGGAIVFFANILLVCAVIFGEVRVRMIVGYCFGSIDSFSLFGSFFSYSRLKIGQTISKTGRMTNRT